MSKASRVFDITNARNTLPTYYFGLTPEMARGRRSQAYGNLPKYPTNKIPFKKFPEEHNNQFQMSLDMSGVRPDDVVVMIVDKTLFIEIEKEFQPDKLAHTQWDKQFGIFVRRLEIPDEVDAKHIFYRVRNEQLEIQMFKKGAFTEKGRAPEPRVPDIPPSPVFI